MAEVLLWKSVQSNGRRQYIKGTGKGEEAEMAKKGCGGLVLMRQGQSSLVRTGLSKGRAQSYGEFMVG